MRLTNHKSTAMSLLTSRSFALQFPWWLPGYFIYRALFNRSREKKGCKLGYSCRSSISICKTHTYQRRVGAGDVWRNRGTFEINSVPLSILIGEIRRWNNFEHLRFSPITVSRRWPGNGKGKARQGKREKGRSSLFLDREKRRAKAAGRWGKRAWAACRLYQFTPATPGGHRLASDLI